MNIVKGAFIGGIIFFLWSNISWMLIGWHNSYVTPIADEQSFGEQIKKHIETPGLYFIPFHKQGTDPDVVRQKMVSGPYARLIVYPNGKNLDLGPMMLIGFLVCFVLSGVMTFLLSQTSGLSLLQKALFTELAGITGAGFLLLSDWNWWGYPLLYVVVMLIDLAIGWFLVGLGLGKFVVIQR